MIHGFHEIRGAGARGAGQGSSPTFELKSPTVCFVTLAKSNIEPSSRFLEDHLPFLGDLGASSMFDFWATSLCLGRKETNEQLG